MWAKLIYSISIKRMAYRVLISKCEILHYLGKAIREFNSAGEITIGFPSLDWCLCVGWGGIAIEVHCDPGEIMPKKGGMVKIGFFCLLRGK